MKKIITLLFVLANLFAYSKVDPYLAKIIAKKNLTEVDVIIVLKKQWDADSARSAMLASKLTASERIRQTVKSVKAFTQRYQQPFLANLNKIKKGTYR